MPLCLLLFILLAHFLASANVSVLPRQIADFELVGESVRQNEVVWVEGVKIAYVNYEALKRDFPQFKKYTNSQIDELLILNFSYISRDQLTLNGIRNTQIPTDIDKTRRAFRPFTYGRADVMELVDFDGSILGLVDRKGVGVQKFMAQDNLKKMQELGSEKIQTMDHSDGLATLGEALVETTREHARRMLYKIDGTSAQTVESYFVMMWPFQIMKGNGRLDRAGIYARQAHLGHLQTGFISPIPRGETSAVQQDIFGAGFDNGLVRITDARLETTFGKNGKRVYDSQKSADWEFAHDTANAFSANSDRSIVARHLEDMLRPLDKYNFQDSQERGTDAVTEIQTFLDRFGFSTNDRERAIAAQVFRYLRDPQIRNLPRNKILFESLLQDPMASVRSNAVFGLNFMSAAERHRWLDYFTRENSRDVHRSLTYLRLEKTEAIDFYSKLANVVSDPYILRSLTRLIEQNQKYLELENQRKTKSTSNKSSVVYGKPSFSSAQCKTIFK